jgi:hypothetical protein
MRTSKTAVSESLHHCCACPVVLTLPFPLQSTRHAVSEAGGQTISSLAEVSVQSSSWIPDDESSPPSPETKTKEQVRRHYVRTLHKVIDESDIIILVLDARDPEGCRSRLVEEEVRRRESEGKKLVFVLNKIGESFGFRTFACQPLLTSRHRSGPSGQC